MASEVEKTRGRRNKEDMGREVAFLVPLCRLVTCLAHLATNTDIGKQRRAEYGVKVTERVVGNIKSRLEAGARCLVWW